MCGGVSVRVKILSIYPASQSVLLPINRLGVPICPRERRRREILSHASIVRLVLVVQFGQSPNQNTR